MQFNILSSTDSQELRVSYSKMRYAVGILAMTLPIILGIGASLVGHCEFPLPSVSHYYFTRMGDVFVAVLAMIAFFLGLYNPDKTQNWLTNIIAVCLFLVAFFPTNYAPSDFEYCQPTSMPHNELRGIVHYLSAVIAFSLLAYMAYFKFPRDGNPTHINNIFRGQALLMVAIMIFFGCTIFFNWFPNMNMTYWTELALLLIFGNLWLMKGYHE
jgi:cell division protein FtsW (lipid II flippase)